MSIGEELLEPPEERSGNTLDPFELFAELEDNSEKLKAAFELATGAPTRKSMAEMFGVVKEADGLIDALYQEAFFREDGNDMLVSYAISALVKNLKVALICAGSLEVPRGLELKAGIVHTPVEEDKLPLRLVVTGSVGPELEAEEAEVTKSVDGFAGLIVASNEQDANTLNGALQAMGKNAYGKLKAVIEHHPVTKEFLQKEEQRKKRIDNAKKISMVAVPAFFASAAGTVAVELLPRYL